MRCWHLVILISFLTQGGDARAEANDPVPIARQLRGLSAEEAASLIEKIEAAQRRLAAGGFQPFELLSGSIASYPEALLPPRTAFLQIRFGEVWDIARIPTENHLWQPYRLAYAPNGLGQPYWDIEVVLGDEGRIERVQMIYKPPAPF